MKSSRPPDGNATATARIGTPAYEAGSRFCVRRTPACTDGSLTLTGVSSTIDPELPSTYCGPPCLRSRRAFLSRPSGTNRQTKRPVAEPRISSGATLNRPYGAKSNTNVGYRTPGTILVPPNLGVRGLHRRTSNTHSPTLPLLRSPILPLLRSPILPLPRFPSILPSFHPSTLRFPAIPP